MKEKTDKIKERGQYEVHWFEERGDASIWVEDVRTNDSVWELFGAEEIHELIEDGFIKWEDDESVLRYLKDMRIIRESKIKEVMGYNLKASDKKFIMEWLKGDKSIGDESKTGNAYIDSGKRGEKFRGAMSTFAILDRPSNTLYYGDASGNVSQTWINMIKRTAQGLGFKVEYGDYVMNEKEESFFNSDKSAKEFLNEAYSNDFNGDKNGPLTSMDDNHRHMYEVDLNKGSGKTISVIPLDFPKYHTHELIEWKVMPAGAGNESHKHTIYEAGTPYKGLPKGNL